MIERIELHDDKYDILSHKARRDQIHVLTVDPILATDVCERLASEKRLKRCKVVRLENTNVRYAVEEMEALAQDTVRSRLLILDVRRVTLPKLRRPFNAIVGYNRRDFNKLCFTICIADGPVHLFRDGTGLDQFIPYLASHRVDYYPAVFFFDPFLHYEVNELETRGIDEQFIIPDQLPRRLRPYFEKGGDRGVGKVREYFRATDKDDDVRTERRRMLRRLYKRRFLAQFPDRVGQMKDLLSRDGVQLATEKLNLYPLYFEDWVVTLIRTARANGVAARHEKR